MDQSLHTAATCMSSKSGKTAGALIFQMLTRAEVSVVSTVCCPYIIWICLTLIKYKICILDILLVVNMLSLYFILQNNTLSCNLM